MALSRFVAAGAGAAIFAGTLLAGPATAAVAPTTRAGAPGDCPAGHYCLYEQRNYSGLKYKSNALVCGSGGAAELKIKPMLPNGAYSLYNNSGLVVEVYNDNGRLLYPTFTASSGNGDMAGSANAQSFLCAYRS
ncbi:peptidase inhibitor family I36 protein [Allokutzneria oryzae]|uniref:Peptidase inhibitor family I36 protein n=1 Tax=Allokutzneria oryzae TaxID=1378989 RepID=A0ABV6A6W7_9PSEU